MGKVYCPIHPEECLTCKGTCPKCGAGRLGRTVLEQAMAKHDVKDQNDLEVVFDDNWETMTSQRHLIPKDGVCDECEGDVRTQADFFVLVTSDGIHEGQFTELQTVADYAQRETSPRHIGRVVDGKPSIVWVNDTIETPGDSWEIVGEPKKKSTKKASAKKNKNEETENE